MDGLLSFGLRRELLVEPLHCEVSLKKSVDAENRDRERRKKRKALPQEVMEDAAEPNVQHVIDVTL